MIFGVSYVICKISLCLAKLLSNLNLLTSFPNQLCVMHILMGTFFGSVADREWHLQILIERLLIMMRDSDCRVRFCAARRIGVLFQTWEGHEEMFLDIWCVYYLHNLVLSFSLYIIDDYVFLVYSNCPFELQYLPCLCTICLANA